MAASVQMPGSRRAGPAGGGEVCAILVSYHPDPELAVRVDAILAQAGALVIVDNGSGAQSEALLEGIAARSRVALIANRSNLGVARALNLGLQRAQELGFAWALLLDQDSVLHAGMLDTLIEVRAGFPDPDRLAVLGAGFDDVPERDAPARLAPGSAGCPRAERWEEVESVITSGSLLSLDTHAAIGPFREEFFIDYVDTEYCFRARSQGYRVIKTRDALMGHAIGAPSRHEWLGIAKWTTNHSPDRRYYIARNDTVMLREYGRYAYGSWALKSLGRRIRTCKRILLYERMKGRKVAAVAAGWWDGVRGRLGPRG
ncbi:MAG TPA: glycosyltransferase family 2 protein [Steroidobacteraceae bacterium]|nr:glycosyltransferase family 2 protein [Steroidobacteraceae bacterium]